MSARITLNGRLTADPTLRFTPAGKAVVNFSVATSERFKDGDEWKDRNTTFWPVTAWDQLAENTAEQITKGQAVIITGRAIERRWEEADGTKRSRIEVQADSIGPDLRWAPGGSRAKPADDPWSKPAATDDPWATKGYSDDSAPF